MKGCLVGLIATVAVLLSGCNEAVTTVREMVSPTEAASKSEPQQELSSDTSMSTDESGVPSAASSPDISSASDGSSSEAPPLTTRFTVPEGYTFARIGLLLEEKEICTSADWLAAAASGDFTEFPLIAEQLPDENRCFDLEGYLFPETYEIYTDESADAILRRMLSHTEQVITPALRGKIAQSGFSTHEILTLASIIEKEAFGPQEMKNISSVLHNRLKEGMRLQCDVTIKYVEGAVKPFISGDIDRYNEHYNTYKCDGLPAGPICNPSLPAIEAALAPADTKYLFFLTDSEHNYLYAETYEDHQENEKKAGLQSSDSETTE